MTGKFTFSMVFVTLCYSLFSFGHGNHPHTTPQTLPFPPHDENNNLIEPVDFEKAWDFYNQEISVSSDPERMKQGRTGSCAIQSVVNANWASEVRRKKFKESSLCKDLPSDEKCIKALHDEIINRLKDTFNDKELLERLLFKGFSLGKHVAPIKKDIVADYINFNEIFYIWELEQKSEISEGEGEIYNNEARRSILSNQTGTNQNSNIINMNVENPEDILAKISELYDEGHPLILGVDTDDPLNEGYVQYFNIYNVQRIDGESPLFAIITWDKHGRPSSLILDPSEGIISGGSLYNKSVTNLIQIKTE